MINFFSFLILVCSLQAHALSDGPPTSKTEDIAAIPLGLVGFGLGHLLQNRFMTDGWKFAAFDGATLLVGVATQMGDCNPDDTSCKDQQRRNGRIFFALFVGSRIWQVVDLSHHVYVTTYASKNGNLMSGLAWNF
jgi:hypothetical protein